MTVHELSGRLLQARLLAAEQETAPLALLMIETVVATQRVVGGGDGVIGIEIDDALSGDRVVIFRRRDEDLRSLVHRAVPNGTLRRRPRPILGPSVALD